MQLTPFFAFGKVWSEQGNILEPQNFASLGLSFNWNWQEINTRIGFATPLIKDNVPSEFQQEFYFSIQKKFSF